MSSSREDRLIAEQARRYEEAMGRETAERQKQLAEAERKQRPKPKKVARER